MSKVAYSVIDGVHRKNKKGYAVVDGVNRKIKKAYSIIGGVARPCWSGGELAYYGTITAFPEVKTNHAATPTETHAWFGGGYTKNLNSAKTVYIYDKSLTRSAPTALQYATYGLAATTVGEYVLFVGGTYKFGNAYDKNLTQKSLTALSSGRVNLCGVNNGKYALFCGGSKNNSSTNEVDAYDSSLTKTTTTLAAKAKHAEGTRLGNYAVVQQFYVVQTFDQNLTRVRIADMPHENGFGAATTTNNHAIFAGGSRGTTNATAYDASFTQKILDPLSVGRELLGATSVEGFALFAGGYDNQLYPKNTVEVYDSSLVRSIGHTLSSARIFTKGATVGNYALFGGGEYDSNGLKNAVDAYVVA